MLRSRIKLSLIRLREGKVMRLRLRLRLQLLSLCFYSTKLKRLICFDAAPVPAPVLEMMRLLGAAAHFAPIVFFFFLNRKICLDCAGFLYKVLQYIEKALK
jgi:hypothetical protein